MISDALQTSPVILDSPARPAIREIPKSIGALLIFSANLQDLGDLEGAVQLFQASSELANPEPTVLSSIPLQPGHRP